MATVVTKTVQASGGDYSSLSAWEAGEQGDLVTADEIRQAECSAFSDTTMVVIDGSTTDSTRYLRVYPAAGAEARMPWSTSAYRVEAVGSVFHVKDGFTRIERIQIRTTSAATSSAIVFSWYAGASGSRALGVVARGNNADASAFHVGFFSNGADTGTVYMVNCVAYDMGTGHAVSNGYRLTQSTDTWYVYNCTAHTCATGFLQSAGTFVAKNCLAAACTDGFGGTFDAASDYNASDLASDAPGANSRNSQTFTFAAEAGDDFHLAGTDAGAKNFGTDLSGDSAFPFSTDFDGVTRSGTWDIGADEHLWTVAITGATTPAGALARQGQKPLAGLTTPGGLLYRVTLKPVGGNVTPSGALAVLKAALRTFSGSLALAGTIARLAGKTLTGTVTLSGALVRQTAKTVTGSTTLSGTLGLIRAVLRSFAGTITPAGALGPRAMLKTLTGTVAASGALTRQLARTLTGAMTPLGVLRRLLAKVVSGSSTPSGTLATVLTEAAVVPLTGKYGPEHASAKAALGEARSFAADHAGAFRDIGAAGSG